MRAQAHVFLNIFIFAWLMILHREVDSHGGRLQYKPFGVAAGSSAAKGGGRGSGTQSQGVTTCLGVMEPVGLSIAPSSHGADATMG